MSMSDDIVANIFNPVPVLQQYKSSTLTTNPFIPNELKELEIETIQKEANNILQEESNKSTLQYTNLNEIGKKMSTSWIGLLDDFFVKPQDVSWTVYFPYIVSKNQRYAYIGLILVIIAVVIIILRKA